MEFPKKIIDIGVNPSDLDFFLIKKWHKWWGWGKCTLQKVKHNS